MLSFRFYSDVFTILPETQTEYDIEKQMCINIQNAARFPDWQSDSQSGQQPCQQPNSRIIRKVARNVSENIYTGVLNWQS